MRKVLSYINSHRYDIHAVFAGLLTVILMHYIKQPIKKHIRQYVDTKIDANPQLEDKRQEYIKHYDMILIALTMLIAFCMFFILSLISPLIEFSFSSAVMSGVFALCEYAVIDQLAIFSDKGGREDE